MEKFLDSLFRCLFLIGFVGIVVTGLAVTYPKHRQAVGLEEEKARILRRIEEKRREIDEVKQKQRRFNTDREFVEALARQNRRVFPGEIVFIFEE